MYMTKTGGDIFIVTTVYYKTLELYSVHGENHWCSFICTTNSKD